MKKIFMILLITQLLLNLTVPMKKTNSNYFTVDLSETSLIANNYILMNHPEERNIVKSFEFIKNTKGEDVYILFNLSPIGYMIYNIENKEFVEYSFKDLSPYKSFQDENDIKIYLGPTLYFVSRDERQYLDVKHLYSLSKDEISEYEDIFKQNMKEEIELRYTDKVYETTATKSVVLTPRNEYFKNLTIFPINDRGTCGWTAGSILLGYFDIFNNNNTVANKWMEGKQIGSISYNGLPSGMTNMPGTISGFDDILMNGRSYATTAYDVQSAIVDYFNTITPTYNSNFNISTQFWPFVGSQAKDHINDGYPYLLFGNYVSPTSGKNINHAVVAYGYNGDTFLVHFGWQNGYREVWINGTHGTGLGLKYNGSHIHSRNIYFSSECRSMCGCGYITQSHGIHTLYYHVYNGNEGERINYNQHRIGCYNCGYSLWENHNWYNPPFSFDVYCTICDQYMLI